VADLTVTLAIITAKAAKLMMPLPERDDFVDDSGERVFATGDAN